MMDISFTNTRLETGGIKQCEKPYTQSGWIHARDLKPYFLGNDVYVEPATWNTVCNNDDYYEEVEYTEEGYELGSELEDAHTNSQGERDSNDHVDQLQQPQLHLQQQKQHQQQAHQDWFIMFLSIFQVIL